MTDQPTPTPRTDAQGYGDGRHPYVPTEFARQLERELAAAKEQWRMSSVCRELRAELDRERALADRLAKWLGNALECDREGDPIPAADIPPSREVLAAWKAARNEAVNPP